LAPLLHHPLFSPELPKIPRNLSRSNGDNT